MCGEGSGPMRRRPSHLGTRLPASRREASSRPVDFHGYNCITTSLLIAKDGCDHATYRYCVVQGSQPCNSPPSINFSSPATAPPTVNETVARTPSPPSKTSPLQRRENGDHPVHNLRNTPDIALSKMRSSALLATACLVLSANALPKPNSPVTYQVVDVGGPTSTAAPTPDTLVETVTKSPPATTVTEAPVTVTISPSSEAEATTTERWTVTIANTNAAATPQPTSSPTSSEAGESDTHLVVAATDTVTVSPVPAFTYAPQSYVPESSTSIPAPVFSYAPESSTTIPAAVYSYAPESSTSTSSTLKPAYSSPVAMWNSTTTSCTWPTAASTGFASVVSTSYPHFSYAPPSQVPGVAKPSGTVGYQKRTLATGNPGGYIAQRAVPGYVPSWNETAPGYKAN